MTCIKKFLYSAAFVFLFSVFTVFGISPNTNAASPSCSIVLNSSNYTSGSCEGDFSSYVWSSSSCPSSSNLYIQFRRNVNVPGFTGSFYVSYYPGYDSVLYSDISRPGNTNKFTLYSQNIASYVDFNSYPDCAFTFDFYSSTISDLFGSGGITPEGSLEITENGTFDVTNYAEAVVNVPTGGDPGSGGSNYHDDLVSINNSIIICAGVALVIYFFYAIYRMMFKGVKS